MRLALMFNSPYLGGAERSFIYQSQFLSKDSKVDFYIPSLDKKSEEIHCLLNESGWSDKRINYFKYPKSLFSVSRSGSRMMNLLKFMGGILKALKSLSRLNLDEYDIIWCNGNKVGLVCYLYCYLVGFKGKLIWHFRDYPVEDQPFSLIWKSFKWKKGFSFELIANSHSVKKSLEALSCPLKPVHVVYNPIGLRLKNDKEVDRHENGYCLAFVGMLAPWKGVEQLIIFSSLFEEELRDLGVSSVKIYGAQIYDTKGEHDNYDQQLEKLAKKLNNQLVEFCGLEKPENIYPKVDLLFHLSLRPEPFGRVLVESMSFGVPVLSTGLGGAEELIGTNQERGFLIKAYDYSGWFELVSKILFNEEFSRLKREQAFEFSQELHPMIKKQIKEVLCSN